MGQTRDLFEKINDAKGTFHAKMGTMKDRNGMDLTEAEDIRRGGKNTQNCIKKGLNDPDNHFAFLYFFFLGMVLITASCTVSRTSVHSSSGTLSDPISRDN